MVYWEDKTDHRPTLLARLLPACGKLSSFHFEAASDIDWPHCNYVRKVSISNLLQHSASSRVTVLVLDLCSTVLDSPDLSKQTNFHVCPLVTAQLPTLRRLCVRRLCVRMRNICPGVLQFDQEHSSIWVCHRPIIRQQHALVAAGPLPQIGGARL